LADNALQRPLTVQALAVQAPKSILTMSLALRATAAHSLQEVWQRSGHLLSSPPAHKKPHSVTLIRFGAQHKNQPNHPVTLMPAVGLAGIWLAYGLFQACSNIIFMMLMCVALGTSVFFFAEWLSMVRQH
jgi:hypothetical protein